MLEKENARLKKLVADLSLNNAILKRITGSGFEILHFGSDLSMIKYKKIENVALRDLSPYSAYSAEERRMSSFDYGRG